MKCNVRLRCGELLLLLLSENLYLPFNFKQNDGDDEYHSLYRAVMHRDFIF